MDEQLIALYHRHVGMAYDRQQRFFEFQKKKGAAGKWQYDPSTATLSYGPKIRFEAPLIGSHTFANNSWLWAWANKDLKLTLTNRALGDTVRATWHRVGLHALGANAFSLEPLLGPELTPSATHILGVILVGELGYEAYFSMSYKGGCSLALIRDDRLKVAEKRPLVRVATIFPKLFNAMPVLDHKAAFIGHAQDYGLTVSEEPNLVRLSAENNWLAAAFDTAGQVTHLEGTVKPETPKPAKKPPTKAAPKAATKTKPAAKKAAAKPAKPKATRPAAKNAAPVKKLSKPARKSAGKK